MFFIALSGELNWSVGICKSKQLIWWPIFIRKLNREVKNSIMQFTLFNLNNWVDNTFESYFIGSLSSYLHGVAPILIIGH